MYCRVGLSVGFRTVTEVVDEIAQVTTLKPPKDNDYPIVFVRKEHKEEDTEKGD